MKTGPDEVDRLVAAAVDGDRAALDRLLRVLRPLVVRYCRSRLVGRSEMSADDVAQEVCLAVLQALPRYHDQGRPFLAFVYGIAAHKVVDAARRDRRDRHEPHAEVPDRAHGETPERQALAGEASTEMRDLLAMLPERQREIVLLRVVVGLSAEETAAAVGSTPGAVRVAQHRAMRRLRGAITPTGEPPLQSAGSSALATLPATWLEAEEARSDWDAAPLTGVPVLDAVFAREDERNRA